MSTSAWQGNDYYVFKDTTDANKIKAKNGRTATIEFISSNDTATVLNSCISALQPETLNYQRSESQYPGGKIVIDAGVFPIRSTIILKSRVQLIGAGHNSTILRLDDSINTSGAFQIMRSYTWNALNGTGSKDGDREITLKDFAIDGNKINNAGGSCVGIQKYGFNWRIDTVYIHHLTSDGIQSQWSSTAGIVDYNGPNNNDYDHYIFNDIIRGCHIWENKGRGIYWKGPNNSYVYDCTIFINGEEAIYVFSDVNGTPSIDGTLHLNSVHAFVNGRNHPKGTGTAELQCTSYMRITDCIFESPYNGWCIKVGEPARGLPGWINGSNIEMYNPITGGLWLTTAASSCNISALTIFQFAPGQGADSNNAIALRIDSDDHIIQGVIHDFSNTGQVGLKINNASANQIYMKLMNNTTGLLWAGGYNNMLYLSIKTGKVGDIAVSGTPIYYENNRVHINSSGPGTNYTYGDLAMYQRPVAPSGSTPTTPLGYITQYIPTAGWKFIPYYNTAGG